MHTLEKKFPAYFESFMPPTEAASTPIKVYRACSTLKVEKESFLSTIEENGFKVNNPDNPAEYSLSTYENPVHVKRFAINNYKFNPPWKIAVGETAPCCGVSQRTKDRDNGSRKSSHVDWWLYNGAIPHEHFELIYDFERYLEDYKNVKKTEGNNNE